MRGDELREALGRVMKDCFRAEAAGMVQTRHPKDSSALAEAIDELVRWRDETKGWALRDMVKDALERIGDLEQEVADLRADFDARVGGAP